MTIIIILIVLQVFNNETCSCECRNVSTCQQDQVFNETLCECRCREVKLCYEGQSFNPDTCSCQCTNNTECPKGQLRNPKTCECECAALSSKELWYKEVLKCRKDHHKVFNIFSCGCECLKHSVCPKRKSINPKNCLCECPPRPSNCNHPMVYDRQSCNCHCPYKLHCGFGKAFNKHTCKCEKTPPSTTIRPIPPISPSITCSHFTNWHSCFYSQYYTNGISCR